MRDILKQTRLEHKMTQQQVADELHVGLRHYKKIESGETLGSIAIWDQLEDMLEVNQRVLREIHPDTKDSQ